MTAQLRGEDEVVVPLRVDRQASPRLLDAVISVSRDLRLREVLQRIVGYACELVDARYGALSVAGPHEAPAEVITHGVEAERLEELPIGRAADRTAPAGSILGVPLLIRGEVFGNLYVAEKLDGGAFTDDDKETLGALATAAGIAVDNARMYELSRQRTRWLQASNEITAALLAEAHPAGELRLVTDRARAVAGAPFAAIALPHPYEPDRLVFEVVEGPDGTDETMVGTKIDVAHTASGQVFSTGQPLLLDQYGDAASTWQEEYNGGAPPALRQLGSAAIVPLAAGEQILGVLLLIKRLGEQPFGEPDLELLQNFAAHAALALRYANARADQRRLAVFADRDRIAGDMQDLVIRRLFDIGLGLQGLSRLVQPLLRARITGLVDDLDGTIRDLRRSIFSLQDDLPQQGNSPSALRDAIARTVTQAADALGFQPQVVLDETLDSLVPQRFRPDLLATLREALANVARHARATGVTVAVRAEAGGLTLEVLDDGVGIPTARERNSGLANLGRRAQRWGGSLVVGPRSGGGTGLSWTVPLTAG